MGTLITRVKTAFGERINTGRWDDEESGSKDQSEQALFPMGLDLSASWLVTHTFHRGSITRLNQVTKLEISECNTEKPERD